MPIKWSALKVEEAMTMVEKIVNEILEPLERAKIVIDGAGEISDLPDYMKQRISSLEWEVSKVRGGRHTGTIHQAIASVCRELPDGAVDAEREKLKLGTTHSLM